MSSAGRRLPFGWFSGLACLLGLVLVSSAVVAEVGVAGDSDGSFSDPSLYEFASIIEDPDPVDGAWSRLTNPDNGWAVLNEGGDANGDGPPSLLYNPISGLPIVAWAKQVSGGFDVVVSHFVDPAWTTPITVAGTSADELDPFLVMNPTDGSVHLFYWVHDPAPRVMHTQAPADLSSWSPSIQVSQLGEIAVRPAAVFFKGTLRVVYEVHSLGYGTTPRQIVLATFNGGGYSHWSLGATQFDGSNWPQVHGRNNRLWVEWIDAQDEMGWRRETAPGAWDPVLTEEIIDAEDREIHVRARVKLQALE